MLDKRQIQASFLFKFKIGHKAPETPWTSNNAFGLRTVNKWTVQWRFKKFCQGNNLEEKHVGYRSEVENDQLRAPPKLILLQLYKKLPKNSTHTIWHLKQIGKVKSSISGCLMSWSKIFKNHCFEVSSYSTQQQTISQSDFERQWKVNCMGKPAMISSVAGWNRSSKALPKAKVAPKKGHGHCLVVCCSSETLWLSDSLWNHYIWEVCSANR